MDMTDIDIKTELNGETVQNSSTKDLIFSIAELVSFLSQGTTLLPGTVILTGTPEGVGFARDPPRYLVEGDLVKISSKQLGELVNTVQ